MPYHIRVCQNMSFLQVNLFVKAIPITATKFSLEWNCVNILVRTCKFCCAILLFQPLSIMSDITCSQCFDVPVLAKYDNIPVLAKNVKRLHTKTENEQNGPFWSTKCCICVAIAFAYTPPFGCIYAVAYMRLLFWLHSCHRTTKTWTRVTSKGLL